MMSLPEGTNNTRDQINFQKEKHLVFFCIQISLIYVFIFVAALTPRTFSKRGKDAQKDNSWTDIPGSKKQKQEEKKDPITPDEFQEKEKSRQYFSNIDVSSFD
jgi:hypothetical protein